MKKPLIVVSSLVLFALASISPGQAVDIVKLTVSAIGANEPAGGAKSGSAWGTFFLNKTKGILCSSIKTKGLSNVQGSHIHTGVKGVTSEIVVTVDAQRFNISGENCVKAPVALIKAIAANPSSYYFNVHTDDFPGGAVRGQLARSK